MSSERHQRGVHLIRISQTCLHLLPLAGVVALASLQGLRHASSGLSLAPQLALLSLLSLVLLIVLRPSSHWGWFVLLGAVTVSWGVTAGSQNAAALLSPTPTQHWMQNAAQRFPSQCLLAVLFVLYVGLALRWWKRARTFRPWLQLAALGFVFLGLVGALAGLKTTAKAWTHSVGWLLFFVTGLELLHQIPQALETAWKIGRSEDRHDTDFPLLLLATFPLAYLAALVGWIYVGGRAFGRPFQGSPAPLLLLLAAHVLAGTALSLLSALHSTALTQESRLWRTLKAAALAAAVFVPFGFGALALFRSLW